MIGNKAMQSLEAGKTYSMRLVFEDRKSYEREFEAKMVRGNLIIVNHAAGDDFIADFTTRLLLEADNRLSVVSPLAGRLRSLRREFLCNRKLVDLEPGISLRRWNRRTCHDDGSNDIASQEWNRHGHCRLLRQASLCPARMLARLHIGLRRMPVL